MSSVIDPYLQTLPKQLPAKNTSHDSIIKDRSENYLIIGQYGTGKCLYHKKIVNEIVTKDITTQTNWLKINKCHLISYSFELMKSKYSSKIKSRSNLVFEYFFNYLIYKSKHAVKTAGYTSYSNLSDLLEQFPRSFVTKSAKEYISASAERLYQIYRIIKTVSRIDKSNHKIDLLIDPDNNKSILKYMIPIKDRKYRLKYQQEIVNKIIQENPKEQFIDFMIKVYYHDEDI